LENAYKFLFYYYKIIRENKNTLWEKYKERKFDKAWEGNIDILQNYFKEISYKEFINRDLCKTRTLKA